MRYCSRNQIPSRLAGRIQLAFEETVQQLLIPTLEDPRIRVVTEYSEAEEKAVMILRYNGPERDVTQTGDELSVTMLKGISSKVSWSATGDEAYPNELEIVIGMP